MALTVNKAFEQFHRDVVNLDPDRTTKARGSRDWLVDQLNQLPGKSVQFPQNYPEKNIKYGSFARNTKIRELDDVDLIYGLHADNAWYSQEIYPANTYLIHTNNAGSRLQWLSDEYLLNSRKIVNAVVAGLSNVEHYKKAEIHRRQEAAILNLSTYEWSFDIVPAFYTVNDFYLIPDGNGKWKGTDPRKDQNIIENLNNKFPGRVRQLVRDVKYWSRHAAIPAIPSYLLEIIVLTFVHNRSTLPDYIDFILRDFWQYLSSAVYNSFPDPKGFQGELNSLSYEDKIKIAWGAKQSGETASAAIFAETNTQDQKRAIALWREIFGNNYPLYG